MPRLSLEETLERAKQDRDQAEARIKRTTAKLKAKDRTADTRRKILLGSLVMEAMAQDARVRAYFEKRIALLTRQHDRDLFTSWEPPVPRAQSTKETG